LGAALFLRGIIFVAEVQPANGRGRHIVGIGGWSSNSTDPSIAYVRAMFVDPAWHGRGIGTSILNTIEASARSAGMVAMEGNASLTAVGFYRHLGFSAERRKDMGAVGMIAPVKKVLEELGNIT
jgi:GNAT superfamily N-acetyltransferase